MAEKKTETKRTYTHATGKRKNAIARVRLHVGSGDIKWGEVAAKKGDILINQKPISEYFPGKIAQTIYEEPLRIVNVIGKYTFLIKVEGGGKAGQLSAVVHGISRALTKLDSEKNRKVLKKRGFLTRDSRVRERRKVGTGGKARRKKQSPKR